MKGTRNSDSAARTAAGFTLLEVMVALAVISISLVVLLGTSNRSIDLNGQLQKISQATLLAQQKMTEIEVEGAEGIDMLDTQERSFEAPFERYRWRTDLEDTPLPSVTMVTVTVLWGDENKNEAVDLTSFLLR